MWTIQRENASTQDLYVGTNIHTPRRASEKPLKRTFLLKRMNQNMTIKKGNWRKDQQTIFPSLLKLSYTLSFSVLWGFRTYAHKKDPPNVTWMARQSPHSIAGQEFSSFTPLMSAHLCLIPLLTQVRLVVHTLVMLTHRDKVFGNCWILRAASPATL